MNNDANHTPNLTKTVAPVSPYESPTTSVTPEGHFETYNTQPFYAMHGRIGRIRYLAILSLCLILLYTVIGIVAAILLPFMGPDSPLLAFFSVIILIILIVAQLYITIALSKRRLNDLGHSGWLSLLMLIPIVSVLFALYLIFAPGEDAINAYGAPAKPPTTVLTIFGVVVPFIIIFCVAGILAAIAVPAYQGYLQRAQEAGFNIEE